MHPGSLPAAVTRAWFVLARCVLGAPFPHCPRCVLLAGGDGAAVGIGLLDVTAEQGRAPARCGLASSWLASACRHVSALSQLESTADRVCPSIPRFCIYELLAPAFNTCISGLVAEYIVAIDVTRGRFPADAFDFMFPCCFVFSILFSNFHNSLAAERRSG